MQVKAIFLLILINLLSFIGFTQEREENEIINQVLLDFNSLENVTKDSVVILTIPIHNISLEDNNYKRIKDKFKRFERTTFDNFINRNSNSDLKLNLKLPKTSIIIDNRGDYKKWEEVLEIHKGYFEIIEFSKVGFNKQHTQAIVYYGYYSGPMTAGGIYIIYKRKGDRWKKKKVIGAWAM